MKKQEVWPFPNSQISFKEHQVDKVKEKKKNTTPRGESEKQVCCFLKLISSFLDILPRDIYALVYTYTFIYINIHTYMDMCKSEERSTQSCPTLGIPTDCSLGSCL